MSFVSPVHTGFLPRKLLAGLLLCASLPLAHAENLALKRFFAQDWERQLRAKPELATEIGERRFNHLLSDTSLAAQRRYLAAEARALQTAQNFRHAKLDAQEALSLQLFIHEKEKTVQQGRFYPYPTLYPMSIQEGIHTDLLRLAEKIPFQNRRDYQNYLARLRAVPRAVDGVIEQLEAGRQSGWIAPRVSVQAVPQQLLSLADKLDTSALGKPLQQIPAAYGPQLKQQLTHSLQQQVRPALLKLARYMQEQYLPAARESTAASALPGGHQYYTFMAAQATTTSMSPQEIHELGLQEVARIRKQMDEVMRSTGFQGTFAEFSAKINREPQFFHTSEAELLQGYRDLIQQIRARLPSQFARLPQAKVDVKAIPALVAEGQPGAYYEPGTTDGTRPGYFVANTSQLQRQPKWKMETLTMHEAEPGHHLQTALTQEITGLPDFRRYGWYVAYGEGWALYAESLGKEMGFFSDPYSMFGHLDDELYRAARLVVDTGLHALGWSRQQAIDYLNQTTANPPADNVAEVDRYICWPGQALGYKIGQLKIRQLRQEAEQALGARFDVRQFHQAWLENGGMPLDLAEKQIKQWQQKVLHTQ